MAKKEKNPSVTVSVPTAAPNKLLQEGYDLIQTGNSADLIEAENRFDQVLAQGDKEVLNALLVLANVYNSKEKLTLDGKELCWERDVKDNQKAYQILLKIKDTLKGEDVLPCKLRLSDEFIQLGGAFEHSAFKGSNEADDIKKAAECYKNADDLGNLEGTFQYADTLTYPIYGAKRYKKAEKYYLLAAENGNAKAMIALARLYQRGCLTDWEEKIAHGLKIFIGFLGLLVAIFLPFVLKLLYVAFFLQKVQLVKSFLFYIKCALLRLPYDSFVMISVADEIGNLSMPFESIIEGYILPVLWLALCCYALFDPRSKKEKRYKKGYFWLQCATNAQDPIGMEQQAYCLFYGIGVKKNTTEAICLFKQSALQDNFNALAFLGHAYEKGRGVPINLMEAQNYYERARQRNLNDGENEGRTLCWLGDAYKKGKCVLQDKVFARTCYDAAAAKFQYGLYGVPLKVQIPSRLRLWMRKEAQAEADFHRAEVESSQSEKNILVNENGKLIVKNNELLNIVEKQFGIISDQQKMLVEYQNALANVYDFWTKSEIKIQNSTEFFDAVEKLTYTMAESQQTEYEKSAQALKERFGDYWERLQPDSRTGLVSARTLYELSTQQNTEDFDFSGVCISATSALENELKKVFLIDYIKFVKTNTLVVDSWPEALRYWSSDSQKWLAKDRFTLGDLPYLLEVKHKTGSEMLNCYLKNILNANDRKANDPRKPFTTSKNGKKSFVSRVDDLRDRYRNPAGHAGAVNVQTAESCLTQIMGSLEAKTRLNATESLIVELFDILK